jgi:hypothetical protein
VPEPLSRTGRSHDGAPFGYDSVVARLVNATLARFGDLHPGSGRPQDVIVGVIRGFDQASRTRAHLVRQSLHDHGVPSADILAVPATMHRDDAQREAESLRAHLAEPADDLRLLVDASAAASGEAERLAARLGVPLVIAAEHLQTTALWRSPAPAPSR